MRRLAFASTLLLALLAPLPTGVQAGHGDVHVECDENDQAVVTDWGPLTPGDSKWKFICINGDAQIVQVVQPRPVVDTQESDLLRPDDWAGWVLVKINGYSLVNPYPDQTDAYLVRGTNRVVLPVRILSEALGAEVTWLPDIQEVRIHWFETEIRLVIGSKVAHVNGETVTLDQPAVIWNDRTFVPLRFVAETFGANVTWDDFSDIANLIMPGVVCGNPYCPFAKEGILGANQP